MIEEPIKNATTQEQLHLVRSLVQAELKDRWIEDYQWAGLVKQRYPFPDPEANDEDAALREAVSDTVEAWKNLYGAVRPSTGRTSSKPTKSEEGISELAALRQEALTALYVADARADEGVTSFRREVLQGRLLPGGEQADQACQDWISSYEGGWMHYGTLMEHRFVADQPDDDKHYRMPNDLRRLNELTEQLAKRYDWIKGAATQFVLSDNTPRVYPIRASGRIPYSWISASRITMVIDPAISPDEVAEFYQGIRKSQSYYAGRQVRPLSAKALRLAAFSAEIDDSEPTTALVKQWNTLHPSHAYDPADPVAVNNFRRDMNQARDRLLHPKLGLTAADPPAAAGP